MISLGRDEAGRIKASGQELSETFQQRIPIYAFVLRDSTQDAA
jgi:hypothetical protein